MTVTVSSPEPPVMPGTTPHPATDAHATRTPADSRAALTREAAALRTGPGTRGRVGELVRGLPIMDPHDSVTLLTVVRPAGNGR
ncbi:hypothetical protein [Streptomyces sp. NPDC001020]